ncbi:hypothetical protein [Clostridium cuniculi]|uniref:hypothetical protein n=1 Tax=Clostridium cuniculi TaxID=2548455 RepID=UPI001054CC8C|nr:hypothetical protein [Clostridium cuniculi]
MKINLKCIRDILISIKNQNYNSVSLEYSNKDIEFNINKLLHANLVIVINNKLTLSDSGLTLHDILINEYKFNKLEKRLANFESISLLLIIQEAKFLNN